VVPPAAPVESRGIRGEVEVDDHPMAYGFLLGYVDLAFRGVQEYSAYRQIVLGPWEEVEPPRGGIELRQWVRGVTEQRTLGPVETLGTMRVRMDFRDPDRKRRRKPRPGAEERARHRVELRVGSPKIALIIDGQDEVRSERLLGLAREVAERFRRQLD
jgi:hypothetical protein